MPPTLASVVFVVFILWMLKRSFSGVEGESLSLWIPTVWLGIMLSKPVAYWVSADTATQIDLDTYLDGSPVDRNIQILLMTAAIVVLVRRHVKWGEVLVEHWALWVFYAYALMSVSWSDYAFVSLKRVIRELGSVLMIMVVLTDAHGIETVRRVFVRCAVVLVPLSVLFIKYYPAIGRYTHRWTYQTMYAGVTTNKNSLGVLAMLGGLFLVWHVVESRKGPTRWARFASVWPEVCVLGMCLWILNIANSATSLACFYLGVLLFAACRTFFNGASARATVRVVVLIGVMGWIALWASELRGFVAQNLGRAPTLTERTDIWAAVLRLPTNPLVGAGFSSVWLTPEGWALSQDLKIPHSHNGFLETFLNGGLVGVALLIAVLLLAARQAARQLSARMYSGAFFVACVITGIVYNFTEVTFNNGNAIGLLLWLIALSAPDGISVRQPRVPGRPAKRTHASRPRGPLPRDPHTAMLSPVLPG
jgi:exopolysaccharide production protein ExoQ